MIGETMQRKLPSRSEEILRARIAEDVEALLAEGYNPYHVVMSLRWISWRVLDNIRTSTRFTFHPIELTVLTYQYFRTWRQSKELEEQVKEGQLTL